MCSSILPGPASQMYTPGLYFPSPDGPTEPGHWLTQLLSWDLTSTPLFLGSQRCHCCLPDSRKQSKWYSTLIPALTPTFPVSSPFTINNKERYWKWGSPPACLSATPCQQLMSPAITTTRGRAFPVAMNCVFPCETCSALKMSLWTSHLSICLPAYLSVCLTCSNSTGFEFNLPFCLSS